MPIDPNFLTKAAKVYEASEAVDGEKPKEVYESHKKCAPGEFGMNKEGEDLQSMLQNIMPYGDRPNQYALPTALGAGLGGVAGGLMSPKGKLLRGMLRGAVVGGGAGLGLGAGQTLIDNNDRTNMEFTPLGRVAVPGAGALAGLTGGLFANRLVDEAVPESDQKDNKKDKKEKAMKKESAYAFGRLVKEALDPAVGYGAAGGGLLGAGLGGLAGFINPGEEEDETGRVRRRSRFGAALRGALGGGAAGALGGGALGHFSPGTVNNLQQMLFGVSKAQAPSPARPRQLVPLPGGKQVMALPGVKTPEALAAEREQHLAEQAKKNKPVAPADEIQLVPPTGL